MFDINGLGDYIGGQLTNKRKIKMKICSGCGISKAIADFPKQRSGKCKLCKNEMQREYRKTREKHVRQQNLGYYYNHRDKRVAECREYQSRNKDAIKKKAREKYYANPLEMRKKYLREKSFKGMPEILIETKALNSLIKHAIRQQGKTL